MMKTHKITVITSTLIVSKIPEKTRVFVQCCLPNGIALGSAFYRKLRKSIMYTCNKNHHILWTTCDLLVNEKLQLLCRLPTDFEPVPGKALM